MDGTCGATAAPRQCTRRRPAGTAKKARSIKTGAPAPALAAAAVTAMTSSLRIWPGRGGRAALRLTSRTSQKARPGPDWNDRALSLSLHNLSTQRSLGTLSTAAGTRGATY